jgi:hypothetical protein
MWQKSNQRSMAGIMEGRLKGKAKERPKVAQAAGTEKRERASPSHGRYCENASVGGDG